MISKIWKMYLYYPKGYMFFDILILLKSIHLLFQKVENIHLKLVLHSRGYLSDFNVSLTSSETSTANR